MATDKALKSSKKSGEKSDKKASKKAVKEVAPTAVPAKAAAAKKGVPATSKEILDKAKAKANVSYVSLAYSLGLHLSAASTRARNQPKKRAQAKILKNLLRTKSLRLSLRQRLRSMTR